MRSELSTQKVKQLETENSYLSNRLTKSETRCSVLEDKIIAIESYSRCNNLKFLNIEREGNVDNCETLIVNTFQRIGLPTESQQLERAHRL